jgi:hypothetical protein
MNTLLRHPVLEKAIISDIRKKYQITKANDTPRSKLRGISQGNFQILAKQASGN